MVDYLRKLYFECVMMIGECRAGDGTVLIEEFLTPIRLFGSVLTATKSVPVYPKPFKRTNRWCIGTALNSILHFFLRTIYARYSVPSIFSSYKKKYCMYIFIFMLRKSGKRYMRLPCSLWCTFYKNYCMYNNNSPLIKFLITNVSLRDHVITFLQIKSQHVQQSLRSFIY